MSKLNIPNAHFALAQHYFDHTPGAVKYSKKVNNMPYSFVKVDDVVYASGYRLGAGNFGIVRMAENALHENFALKVEGHGINHLDLSESEILKLVGYHYGFAERQLEKEITFSTGSNSIQTDKKLYKVMKLLEGNDLVNEIYDIKPDSYTYKNSLTQTQSLIIAIKCCQNLKQLHQKRIIHRDIKPENIKTKIAGNDITVSFMDFGLSVMIPAGKTVYPKKEIAGTPLYMAPEIYNELHPELSKCETSYASDVYALGTLFQEDLQLPPEAYEPMVRQNPRARINLDVTLNNLVSLLQQQPDLDEHAHKVINSVKGQRPLPKPPIARDLPIKNVPVKQKMHTPQHVLSVRNIAANRVRVMVDVQPGFKLKPVAPKVAPVAPKKAAPVAPKAAPGAPKAAPVAPKVVPVAPKVVPVAPKVVAPVAPKAAPVAPKVAPMAPKVVAPVAPKIAPLAPKVAPAAPVAARVNNQNNEVKALILRFNHQKPITPSPIMHQVPASPVLPVPGVKNLRPFGVKVF